MDDFSPDLARSEKILEEKREKFEAFSTMLLECNGKFNLTAITAPREVEVKHFLDSLAAEPLFPQGAHVAEVGSGAGFPSIPLMIAREDLFFTLIESTRKKCEFLRAAIGELSLAGEVICARAEDVGKDPAFREKFDVSCARAVASLPTLAEYCLPLTRRGGLFLAYKGEKEEGGERAICTLGGRREGIYRYELPDGMGKRTLIAVRKEKATPAKYPRGRGAERKDPIL